MADTGAVSTSSADTAKMIEQRWAQFHRWGPYALLAFSVVMALATGDLVGMGRGDWYVSWALVGSGVALQLWWGRPAPTPPEPSPAAIAYYALRWAIAFALAWINPFFAFYAVLGYFGAERLLPPRLLKPGLFATAVTMSGSQSGGLPPDGELGWIVFGGLIAVNVALLTVFAHLAAQEDERARVQTATIIELERTNTALQQAMDENAALHAQLLLQAREAGVADERRRLAAEIHDTIAQGLTGIIAQLQVVANAEDEQLAKEHLDRAAALARHSLGEARRSVHNLSPTALEHDTLPEALKKTVAEWAERTGVRADFTLTGTAEHLHDEIEATLLRIVQEALSNAARHAGAARLGVTLSFMGDEVTLDVRDDGRGFDPLALPARSGAGGFGLDGMRARAERIAGSLTVESEPGGGTAVSARVPLVRHEH
ncbi:sensor histidine kinase [Streptomyces sp. NPDC041068]|uniref:sensor histidine kinase n=1 Tax=Streptomyces sp. NPDC041068 TaxID=3155130 RepID=UPI00340E4550